MLLSSILQDIAQQWCLINVNIRATWTEEETNALIDYFYTNQSTTTLSSSARDYKGAAAHISTLFKGRPKMVKSIKAKFSHVSFQQYGRHPFKLLIFQQIKTRWTLIDKYRRSSGVSWDDLQNGIWPSSESEERAFEDFMSTLSADVCDYWI